jgi:hypothetical protein
MIVVKRCSELCSTLARPNTGRRDDNAAMVSDLQYDTGRHCISGARARFNLSQWEVAITQVSKLPSQTASPTSHASHHIHIDLKQPHAVALHEPHLSLIAHIRLTQQESRMQLQILRCEVTRQQIEQPQMRACSALSLSVPRPISL